jgi:hypothetical protein
VGIVAAFTPLANGGRPEDRPCWEERCVALRSAARRCVAARGDAERREAMRGVVSHHGWPTARTLQGVKGRSPRAGGRTHKNCWLRTAR